MAIPIYLWLTDEVGNPVNGSVDIRGREGSIEVTEFMHAVELPVDDLTGKITNTRRHGDYAFVKEIDSASTYLFKSLTSGRKFSKAVFKFYRINYNGQEEEYFRTTLENVRVTELTPFMMDIKNPLFIKNTHHEAVLLSYEKITWHYFDGNIIHSDSWNERETA